MSDVEDVRPVLQYYNQFDDPTAEFRRRAEMVAKEVNIFLILILNYFRRLLKLKQINHANLCLEPIKREHWIEKLWFYN